MSEREESGGSEFRPKVVIATPVTVKSNITIKNRDLFMISSPRRNRIS
jgi:hypothetical protein